MTRAEYAAACKLLGIAQDADAATRRAAWRDLVRSYHPDLARTNAAEANRRLAEINAAFDVVSMTNAADPDEAASQPNAAPQTAARRARRQHAMKQALKQAQDRATRQAEADRAAGQRETARRNARATKARPTQSPAPDCAKLSQAQTAFDRARSMYSAPERASTKTSYA